MNGAVTTAGRVTRREICAKHGIEYGQTYIPGAPGQREAIWEGACRECEAEFRRERQAAEEVAAQVEEIEAETERRIAADSDFEKKIQEKAAEDLREGLSKAVADYCALHRPDWETFHRNSAWNQIFEQVKSERQEEFAARLRSAERR